MIQRSVRFIIPLFPSSVHLFIVLSPSSSSISSSICPHQSSIAALTTLIHLSSLKPVLRDLQFISCPLVFPSPLRDPSIHPSIHVLPPSLIPLFGLTAPEAKVVPTSTHRTRPQTVPLHSSDTLSSLDRHN